MLAAYLLTLIDYVAAALGIGLVMFLTYALLPRLGLSREAATGFARLDLAAILLRAVTAEHDADVPSPNS